MSFRSEDRVVYGIHGVCRVLGVEQQYVNHKQVEYYVLSPCNQPDARYFVPCHNEAAVSKMRKLLTPAELDALLDDPELLKDKWIPEENLRREAYRKLISRGNCGELIAMVRCLLIHRRKQMENGRKLHISDENFLKDAKRVISAEVSDILQISPQEVEEYLEKRLNK